MPTATAHKILRQPIYMDEFEWAGKMYKGLHEPLVRRDLWEHVPLTITGKRSFSNSSPGRHGFRVP